MPIFKSIKPGKSITKIINYVSKEAIKNNDDEYCAGINVDKNYKLALEQMQLTKELWNKTDGRKYQHYVLSFGPEDKISAEDALKYAKGHAEKCFGGYETFLAVHQESQGKKLHVHYVVNSVSFVNGKKIQTSKRDYEKFKDFNDQIAKKYGLNIINRSAEAVKKRGRPQFYSKNEYQQYQRDVKNNISLKCALAIKRTLDQKPKSFEEFQKILILNGWKAKLRGKTLTFVDIKTGRKIRANTLAKKINTDELKTETILKAVNYKITKEQVHAAAAIVTNKKRSSYRVNHLYFDDSEKLVHAGIKVKISELDYER